MAEPSKAKLNVETRVLTSSQNSDYIPNLASLAQQNYDRQSELFEKKIIAQATLDTYVRNLETARQTLTGARAEEERARLAGHGLPSGSADARL